MPVGPVTPVDDNGWCLRTFGDIRAYVKTVMGDGVGGWGPLTGCAINGDESILYVCDAASIYKIDLTGGLWGGSGGWSWAVHATGFSGARRLALDADGYVYVCESTLTQVSRVSPSGVVEVVCTLPSHPTSCDIYYAGSLSTDPLLIIADDGNAYQYIGAPGGAASLYLLGGIGAGADVIAERSGSVIGGAAPGLCLVDLLGFGVVGAAEVETDGAVTVYAGAFVGDLGGPASAMHDGGVASATFLSVTDTTTPKPLTRHIVVVGDGPSGTAIRAILVNPLPFLDYATGGPLPGGKLYMSRGADVFSFDFSAGAGAGAGADFTTGVARIGSFPANPAWFRDMRNLAVDAGGNVFILYYQEGANPGDPVPPGHLYLAKMTPGGVLTDPWVAIPGTATQHFSDDFEVVGAGLDGNLYVMSPAAGGYQQVHRIDAAGVATEIVPLRDPSNNYTPFVAPAAAADGTLWLVTSTDPDNASPVNSVLVKYDPSSGAVTHVPVQAVVFPDTDIGALTTNAAGDLFALMEGSWVDEVPVAGGPPLHIAGTWTGPAIGHRDGCGVGGGAPTVSHGRIRTQVGGGAGSLLDDSFSIFLDDDGMTLWLADDQGILCKLTH